MILMTRGNLTRHQLRTNRCRRACHNTIMINSVIEDFLPT